MDAAGNAAADFTDRAVRNASGRWWRCPRGRGRTPYAIGDTISLTATFPEAMTVSGTPRIAFTVGTATRHAVYASGSTTKALEFTYTVAEGRRGQRRDSGRGERAGEPRRQHHRPERGWRDDATLTHAAVAASTSHRVDGVLPAVDRASVNGTEISITFEEALGAAGSLTNGAFTVKKTPAGGSEQTVSLSGAPSISGQTVTLTLSSAVVATDTGVKVTYSKPTTGSGTGSWTRSATRRRTSPTSGEEHERAGVGGVLGGGDGQDVRDRGHDLAHRDVPEAVTVSGTPRIALRVGTATRHAVYASGSTTAALVFSYTVVEGDADSDGIAVGANALANTAAAPSRGA